MLRVPSEAGDSTETSSFVSSVETPHSIRELLHLSDGQLELIAYPSPAALEHLAVKIRTRGRRKPPTDVNDVFVGQVYVALHKTQVIWAVNQIADGDVVDAYFQTQSNGCAKVRATTAAAKERLVSLDRTALFDTHGLLIARTRTAQHRLREYCLAIPPESAQPRQCIGFEIPRPMASQTTVRHVSAGPPKLETAAAVHTEARQAALSAEPAWQRGIETQVVEGVPPCVSVSVEPHLSAVLQLCATEEVPPTDFRFVPYPTESCLVQWYGTRLMSSPGVVCRSNRTSSPQARPDRYRLDETCWVLVRNVPDVPPESPESLRIPWVVDQIAGEAVASFFSLPSDRLHQQVNGRSAYVWVESPMAKARVMSITPRWVALFDVDGILIGMTAAARNLLKDYADFMQMVNPNVDPRLPDECVTFEAP